MEPEGCDTTGGYQTLLKNKSAGKVFIQSLEECRFFEKNPLGSISDVSESILHITTPRKLIAK